jgi:predicted secreted protein
MRLPESIAMREAAVRAAVLVAVLGLAGCAATSNAGSDWSELGSNPREFFNLNAPVTLAGAEVDGQRVTLKRGQALVVKLDAEVGTDLRWEMQRYDGPNVIAPVRHDLTAKPGANPAAAGGVGDATFRVRGVAAGTQPVVIEYKRAFEATAAKTIRFDVVVP